MSKTPDSVDSLDSRVESDSAAPSFSPPTADEPLTVIRSQREQLSPPEDEFTSPSLDPQLVATLFPEDSSSETELSPHGLMLEHFRLEKRIGSGGMGSVFLACDTRLDRTVAVKVLSPAHAKDSGTIERFRNEAKATARLDHENIARVFFYGEDKGLHFIAYEYVTGPNLREILSKRGILSADEAVNYTLQIASAIQHASDAGVIHRDIKPSNIIVTPSGRAKLVDLGLARKQLSQQSGELTIAGTTLGTFDYISPEQAKDPRTVDIRSDIYSLGCTLYHLLTGEPPYAEGTVLQKLLDHREKTPPNPSQKNPRVPQLLSSAVQKMMASNPKSRYQSADSLIQDLMRVSGELGLKTVGPDGFIWTAVLKDNRKFWERHLGWTLSTLLLLAIVVLADRYSVLSQSESENRSLESIYSRSNGTNGNADLEGNFNPNKIPSKKKQPDEKTDTNRLAKNETNASEKKPKENSLNKPDASQSNLVLRGLKQFFSDDERNGFSNWMKILGFSTGFTDRSTPNKDTLSQRKTAKNNRSTNLDDRNSLITILQDGEARSFASLEAACTAAKDGDVVLLKYNGHRRDSTNRPIVEQPISIRNKKIAIRAVDGYRPLIEFAPDSAINREEHIRMVNLGQGSLEIYNVELTIRVNLERDLADYRQWTFFALSGADRLFLKGVNITFVGDQQSVPATVVDLLPRLPVDLADMTNRDSSSINSRTKPEIQFEHCFIRGACTLLSDSRQTGLRLEIENTAIVIEGSVVEWTSSDRKEMGEDQLIEIDLEHVTCLAKKGLMRVAQPADSNWVPPYFQFTARGNLFSIPSTESLLSSVGSMTLPELRKKIRWNGGQNYYDRIGTFWRLKQTREPNMEKEMNFEDWMQHWVQKEGDLDAHNEAILWEVERKNRPTSRIGLSHLALQAVLPPLSNPALTGASDGKAVGARLEQLNSFENETPLFRTKKDKPSRISNDN